MAALKELYIKKCREFSVAPIAAFVEDLDSAGQDGIADVRLNGNSKRLFNSRVQPMQVFPLCEALATDTNAVVLDLSFNKLNDLAAQAIAGLIKANTSIKFINLAGNDIGAEGAGHLARALSSQTCGLQVLSLSGNNLGEEGVLALADMLRVNTSLRALDISDVCAGVKAMIGICSAMGSEGGDNVNSTLQALDLGAPVIHMQQDTVVLQIARMLTANTMLSELGLSKHKMVDSQFEILVNYGLLRNQTLQSLDLRANRLSAFSGPQLERVMTECRQLVGLNVAANQLGDGGARALATCLPYCPWITRLDLRNNNIGEQGLIALAEALGLASHLRLLLLWGNHMGPAASRALMDALTSIQQQGGSVVTDLHPYEVDGRAQVALLQVEPDSVEEEQGQEEEGDAAEQGGETDEGTTAYGYEQAQQQQMVQQEALRAY